MRFFCTFLGKKVLSLPNVNTNAKGKCHKNYEDMEMSEEAKMALNIIEQTSANLFLTGKAGTGKTTFLKELRRLSPKRMVILAPTGIAAINAGGQTIHSFFQLPLSPYVPGTAFSAGDNSRKFKFSNVKRKIIRTLDLLVIDEISMVRSDLLDAVDDALRRYRKSAQPFGGVQLLMIGDLHQLAPVTTGSEEQLLQQYYDTPYFFSSKALQAAGYLTVELKKVYRQQDTHFLQLLNQIRSNQATQETLAELNRRYIPGFQPGKADGYIRLTTHNAPAQRINEEELAKLGSKAYVYDAETEGDFPEMSYPTDYRLTLKEGAQVMFIKNDVNHRYYNGMIGEVTSLDNEHVTVRSKDTGETISLERERWDNSKYTLNKETMEIEEKVEGTFCQYPLRLAWAITIHKSQGLTFEHAIIDASHSFTHGQTYVALSRCKSLEGMVLSAPLSQAAIIKDETVDAFTGNLQTPSPETLSQLERIYVVHNISELFDLAPMRQANELMMRTIAEFFSSKYQSLIAEYQKAEIVFKNLVQVADKFKLQYSRILSETGTADNALLQERIHKAAAYFADKMDIFKKLVKLSNINTENKTAKKLLKERLQSYCEEIDLKSGLLTYYADGNPFSTAGYLKKKARLLLTDDPDADGPDKKRHRSGFREQKEKKERIDTKKVSFDLYKSGLKVEEIARQRALAPSTIMSHLSHYVIEGELGIRDFVSSSHEQKLREFISSHPDASYSEIRAAVGENYSYGEISMVAGIMLKLSPNTALDNA